MRDINIPSLPRGGGGWKVGRAEPATRENPPSQSGNYCPPRYFEEAVACFRRAVIALFSSPTFSSCFVESRGSTARKSRGTRNFCPIRGLRLAADRSLGRYTRRERPTSKRIAAISGASFERHARERNGSGLEPRSFAYIVSRGGPRSRLDEARARLDLRVSIMHRPGLSSVRVLMERLVFM